MVILPDVKAKREDIMGGLNVEAFLNLNFSDPGKKTKTEKELGLVLTPSVEEQKRSSAQSS